LTPELILAAAMRSEMVAEELSDILRSDLALANPYYLNIAQFMVGFLNEYNRLPQQGDYGVWAQSLAESQRPAVISALADINRQNLSGYTFEYLASEAAKQLQTVAARNAVARLNTIRDVTPEILKGISEEVESLKSVSLDGLANIAEVHKYLQPPRDDAHVITTGIPALDRWIEGWKEELWFLLAESGLGKTTTLINFGKAAALTGHNVLHISLENALSPSIHRYYRSIAQVDRGAFRSDLAGVESRLHHWVKFVKGSIHVIYVDAFSIHCEDVLKMVARFVRRYGRLDLLSLDYLDLLAPAPSVLNKPEHQQLGHASHRIRTICPTYHASVLSAAQATRESFGRRLQMQSMGASIEKLRAADGVLGLSQTEEEAEQNQARLSGLKTRESAGRGREIPVYYNMDLMMVADLDHPNTQRIIAEINAQRN
jgi:hypothetical protein